MEKQFDQHISRQFNQELEMLRQDVMAMGGVAEEMVRDAVAAVMEGDTAKAQRVIDMDDQVNEMEKEIDEQSTMILARRQPTASDLRLVLAIIRTVNDLERIGDEAEKIARLAVRLADVDRPRGNYQELENMGNTVRGMLHDALDGFARLVPETAVKLVREDEKVDVEYEGLLRQYYTYLVEEPRNTSRVLDCIWIARSIERIGDHAKNIGEYIIYLVEGKDMRHATMEEMEKTISDSRS
ncbi:phosphate signaling complex protein PhoU [Wenzhouxiangella marina]|uniref:Phosphate-specific transport system accessory protein PhoU n=1 Tax=Wenzhouxiangella marina TaxID=1579979 RepID=A0A0K0XX84_9GAMM|nr:phosphate signaling complex protein PhoU [Wenzhouxiangella marina]AKS42221.1 Phosphate-specific transport system accessory protein PhoU [Wenzhouxiangella marina]MBB6086007.1 phosphate transport system protein [Wenzhouxiangella marina]